MFSYRYGWTAFVLFLVVLFPTIWSFYRGLPTLTDRVTARLPEELAGMSGTSTNRKGKRMETLFRTEDWIERVYTGNLGQRVTLFVARGFDGRPLFHFPERGLLRRNWFERTHEIRLLRKGHTTVKAHTLRLAGEKVSTRALYILLYDEETIGNPYLFLLGRIPRMLVGEREPFTFLFAHCSEGEGPKEAEQAIESLLMAAMDYLLKQNLGG
jgi:hypothetical protein